MAKVGFRFYIHLAILSLVILALGYYFASNKSKYFGLGIINQDQLEDYAKRRKISIYKV